MNRSARAALADVDVVAMLVEAGRWTEADDWVLGLLEQTRGARFLVINKCDRITPREKLLPFIEACSKRAAFDAYRSPCRHSSHRTWRPSRTSIRARLPESPHLFEEDEFTDRTERFLVAETVREKLMRRVGDGHPAPDRRRRSSAGARRGTPW
ncbi:MAG: hypothetical protein U5R48_13095 [Gammaproteobacteria bacterium]|nr:hypothetical protein [Gammaproteobacteria bacterium]